MSTIDTNQDNGKSNQDVHWTAQFHRSGKSPISDVHNIRLIIENDEQYFCAHAFNEMSRSEVRLDGTSYIDIDDKYLMSVQSYVSSTYIPRIGLDIVRTGVILDCERNKFHPIRKELTDTIWDKERRIEGWVPKYLGTDDNEYNRKIGLFFIISMVKRIFEPGCKCDYMMVLEGEQGIKKSTVCAILFGRYFSNYLPDINSKDASQHVSSFWGIEIDEMHVFTNAETAALKSFISRQEEAFRPPYGRMLVRYPRQCLFIGTTNKDLYLKDETGGRRFWPVKCTNIDTEGLKRDRSQLLAEAVVRYRDGWQCYPDAEFEAKWIIPEQQARQEFDELENIMAEQLRLGNNSIVRTRTTIAEIYQKLLAQGSQALPSNAEQIRIGKMLTRLEKRKLARSFMVTGKKYWDISKVS